MYLGNSLIDCYEVWYLHKAKCVLFIDNNEILLHPLKWWLESHIFGIGKQTF